MKVTLMDYTGKFCNDPWYAAAVMIWTKRTRIEMSPGGLEEIMGWSEEAKTAELKYMSATIPSSWEFCDYTFLIADVTRAFTHQLVRTRTASYAQQTMMTLDMTSNGGWRALAGPSLQDKPESRVLYETTMDYIRTAYDELVHTEGVKMEDARGVLPTNILTNIVMKANLRTLCDMFRKRASPRNQGEFVDVQREMRRCILEVHPWADIFLSRTADVVAHDAYELLEGVKDKTLRTNITKCIDQLLSNVGAGDQ